MDIFWDKTAWEDYLYWHYKVEEDILYIAQCRYHY